MNEGFEMLRSERRSFFCPNKLWAELVKDTGDFISISTFVNQAIVEKLIKDNPGKNEFFEELLDWFFVFSGRFPIRGAYTFINDGNFTTYKVIHMTNVLKLKQVILLMVFFSHRLPRFYGMTDKRYSVDK